MTRLPEQLTALARRAAGPITTVIDRSWPRDSSAVWEVTGASNRRWFVKQHSSLRFHDREVAALRNWAPALGPGSAPVLAGADRDLRAMVVTALPGQVVAGMQLTGAEEREIYRQAGVLLRRLHEATRPKTGDNGVDRVTARVEEHLRQAAGLLTSREIALVRFAAAELTDLPPLPAVPAHGDVQPRNFLWDRNAQQLALIDFERAEPAPAIRDLVRLEFGPWDRRPDLRDAFARGYGRELSKTEQQALRCLAALDALSGLLWSAANDDGEVTGRARRTLDRLSGTLR